MKKTATFIAVLSSFLMIVSGVQAQVIKGSIEDEKGNRIAYAALYVKELKQGVTANENGEFELTAPAGVYTCTFRCLGYEMATETITLTAKSPPLKIVLAEKIFELASVRISASDEDPAYGIMRRAISRAPFYRRTVTEYVADVYIKGSLKVGEIKGLVGLAMDRQTKKALSNSSGVVESVNEIHFKAPDTYEHRVKSIQQAVSFDVKDFDMPELKMGMMVADIYNPNMKILSTRAFSDYKFVYEGDFTEGNLRVNKIKVTPKYKRDDLYNGYIYIVEDLWNVYSFDLTAKYMGLNFRLEQHYGEAADNIYLPVSSNASLNGKLMGVSLNGNYNSSIKYSLITPNSKLTGIAVTGAATEPKKENPKKEKIEKQLEQIVSKDNISTRDMRKAAKMQQQLADITGKELQTERGEKKTMEVTKRYVFSEDSIARKRDTAYWQTMRPIPLVHSEAVTFQKHDSIKLAASGGDTTAARKRNQLKNLPFKIIGGHTYRIDSTLFITHHGLLNLNAISFNTVDGFVYRQSGVLRKRFAGDRRITLNASAAYAFSRNAFLWDVAFTHRYMPQRRAQWEFSAGRQTADYAGDNGIDRTVNTYASLLFRVNYPVLFDRRYVHIGNTIDIANGLQLLTAATYADNRQETNHSDFSFFYTNSRDYRPNVPRHAGVYENPALLQSNIDFQTNVTITYTPQYYYRMVGKRKQMAHSDYPTFKFLWQRGWDNVCGSHTDFDFLSLQVFQSVNLHPEAAFDYAVTGGFFPNSRKMSFSEYRHFYSNQPAVTMQQYALNRPFQLLPAYTYSTNEWFAAAGADYHAYFLALKYLPFLTNTLMGERLSVSYLLTPQLRHYSEWGYALTDIYFFGELGIFAGFEGAKYYGWGVRAAINLSQ